MNIHVDQSKTRLDAYHINHYTLIYPSCVWEQVDIITAINLQIKKTIVLMYEQVIFALSSSHCYGKFRFRLFKGFKQGIQSVFFLWITTVKWNNDVSMSPATCISIVYHHITFYTSIY